MKILSYETFIFIYVVRSLLMSTLVHVLGMKNGDWEY